jgi:cellulose biosynthesis protein BcsQ
MACDTAHAPRASTRLIQCVQPSLQDSIVPLRTAPRQIDMKIIAVTNIKGGVGKTTTAVNLSYLCAAGGGATLLWDLDPQGAATYTLRGEPLERASPKKLLSGKRHLPELVMSTGYPGLDLLPNPARIRT